MGRPREHGPDTRAALLRSAAALLARGGIEAVTVRHVALEAGTTTRAVYSLFGDKDGLLRALFRDVTEAMVSRHIAVPKHDDPVREIAELAAAYRSAAREQADLYPYYVGPAAASTRTTGQTLGPSPDEIAKAFTNLDRIVDAVSRAVATGRFPGRTPEAVARQLWAIVHGLALLEIRGHLGDEGEAAEHWRQTIAAALAGYQAPATTR